MFLSLLIILAIYGDKKPLLTSTATPEVPVKHRDGDGPYKAQEGVEIKFEELAVTAIGTTATTETVDNIVAEEPGNLMASMLL